MMRLFMIGALCALAWSALSASAMPLGYRLSRQARVAVRQATEVPVQDVWKVAFDAQGGSLGTTRPTIVTNGCAVGKLPEATREGYDFVGWFTAADGGEAVTAGTVVTADVTYYAHWTEIVEPELTPMPEPDPEPTPEPTPTPVPTLTPTLEPVAPCYEVIEAGDITAPYAVPKAATLMGAVYDGCDVVGIVELKLGKVNEKKGTSKVSGSVTTLDGKKHAITAYNLAGIDGTAKAVPLAVKDLGTMEVTIGGTQFAGSLGGWHVQPADVGGSWTKGTATATVEAGSFSMFAGTVLSALLPDEETATVKNSKWAFAKAASVKWAKPKKSAAQPEIYDAASGKGLIVDMSKDKTNLSGLKLTYTPKKGTFMGSFKVYALEGAGAKTKLKTYTVNVSGVVVDGVGSGKATCKKPAAGPWPVTVR